MPPIWVGFFVLNSLRKGPFFGKLSLNMGEFAEIGKKLSKMGCFPPKLIIKVGMEVAVRSQKRVAF